MHRDHGDLLPSAGTAAGLGGSSFGTDHRPPCEPVVGLLGHAGRVPHRIGAQKAGLKPVFERPSAEASARAVQVCEPSGAVSGGVLPPTNDI